MKWQTLLLGAVALGGYSLALAEIATFSPDGQNDAFYSISIPDATASSGSGPILFQIKAPSTLQWIGLGQGTRMAGANIFVLYSSSSDNVTISPRSVEGHSEPQFNPDTRVTLLEGSGIQDGTMTANVRCDNCINWQGGSLDPKSSKSQWIWAYKEGQPLNSADTSQRIRFHDGFGTLNVDLSQAVSTSDNPFLGSDPSTEPNSAATGASGGSGGGNSMLIAHGFLMAFAFVLLFPSFALLVPIPVAISVPKVHAPLQAFTLAVAIAGMGLGIRLWVNGGTFQDVHPILGIIVMAFLILFQPAMGWLQHMHFRKTGGKTVFSYAHRWLGRIMIILGIINGGLGFRLAGVGNPGTPQSAMIAYSVIAGVVGIAYILVHLLVAVKARRGGRGQELVGERRKQSAGEEEVGK